MYNKYLWEKCWLSLFYRRIYQWMPLNEAIKPVKKKEKDVRSKLFANELERYYKQPEPKPDKAKFYWRLFKWYTKEQAIQVELVYKKRKPTIKKNWLYIVPHTKPISPKQDNYEIRITYSKEEADVIKKEYEMLINVLETTIYEDELLAKENKIKIEWLKQEYLLFKTYNP